VGIQTGEDKRVRRCTEVSPRLGIVKYNNNLFKNLSINFFEQGEREANATRQRV